MRIELIIFFLQGKCDTISPLGQVDLLVSFLRILPLNYTSKEAMRIELILRAKSAENLLIETNEGVMILWVAFYGD